MNRRYSVLIIGAGNIGAFFDSPSSRNVLTHAHAFSKHHGFRILGFYDTDKKRAIKAAETWNVVAKELEFFFDGPVDVVCVSIPDEYHYSVLKKIHNLPVKMVFLEKPVTKRLDQAGEIRETYKRKRIPICLNYRRRFIPEFHAIKKDIENKRYGNYVSGSGYYGKGLLHNGSHMIDLFRYFVSEPKKFRLMGHSFDYTKDDPSVTVELRTENDCSFVMHHVDPGLYTIFEMDLLFEKARIRMVESGFKFEIHKIKTDGRFRGYRNMEKDYEIRTSLGNAMYYAADNIYNYLKSSKELDCSIEDGCRDLKICVEIKEALKGNVKKNIIAFS